MFEAFTRKTNYFSSSLYIQIFVLDAFYNQIPAKGIIPEVHKQIMFESISVNSNYESSIEPAKQPGEMPKQIGNKTECALLGLVNDLGGNYQNIRLAYPTQNLPKVFTFNSARKMMATIVNIKNPTVKNENEFRVHAKGASEIVLAKCSRYLDGEGKVVELTDDKRNELIKSVVEAMASEGLRTICIAYRDLTFASSQIPDWSNEDQVLNDLTCLCLVGIEDPVRAEVPDAIKKCQSSGVVVRMITGDNIKTATSIALKV